MIRRGGREQAEARRQVSQSALLHRSADSLHRGNPKSNERISNSSFMEGIPDEINYSSSHGESGIRIENARHWAREDDTRQ